MKVQRFLCSDWNQLRTIFFGIKLNISKITSHDFSSLLYIFIGCKQKADDSDECFILHVVCSSACIFKKKGKYNNYIVLRERKKIIFFTTRC